MKEKVSIVKSVFGRIAEIWGMIPVEEMVYTTDNIHRSTVKKVTGISESAFQQGGKRKRAYDNVVN